MSLARGTQLAPNLEPFQKSLNLREFDMGAWLGIMVPAGTPKPIVDRLAQEVDRTMKLPEVRRAFDSIFVEVDYRPTEDFTRLLRQARQQFADVIKRGNIKAD